MPHGKADVAEEEKQTCTSSWGINHPGSIHTKFYSRNNIDHYSPGGGGGATSHTFS